MVVPADTPVIWPLVDTIVATEVLVLDHDIPPTSETVLMAPWHNAVAPDIGPGTGSTVTAAVLTHPKEFV